MACLRIRHGLAERMLCGGSEGASHYIWAGFDAMRVLMRAANDDARAGVAADERQRRRLRSRRPARGCCVLESLDSARARGARIHAELARRRRQLRRPPRRRQHDGAESRRACGAASAPRSRDAGDRARRRWTRSTGT